MIPADTMRNFQAISACKPFDRLTESERLLVAEHVRYRRHAPGDLLLPKGTIAERLIVVIAGTVSAHGTAAPSVFDAESALFGLPARADHITGATGAETLCLARPHLFTIARECPDFIVGLASLGPATGS